MAVRHGRRIGVALGVIVAAGSSWASDARVELTVSGADASRGSIRARIFTADGYMDDPKERVGMSNNAKGRMGPAKWKDAKFNAEAGTTTMAIDLVDAT